MLKFLVLGGTRFLGRHFVRLALEAEHEVTLFNRGETNPDLFPEAEHRRGDRAGDLEALSEGSWDAVVDTSGYFPDAVRAACETLAGRADHYAFISTISVYADPTQMGLDEEAATAELSNEDIEQVDEITGESYGPLKAASERAARASFDGDVLVLRPGLIVGPHDPTGRFTYWPRRISRGGEVLAPGNPERQVQLIDVRDLAAWLLDCLQEGRAGTFNVTGPAERLSMEAMLQACNEAVEAEPEFTWVDEEFLLETGVEPWTELPLWLPEARNGTLSVDISRALAAGLELRPLVETARETLDWELEATNRIHRGPAIGPARELALLQAWKAQRS